MNKSAARRIAKPAAKPVAKVASRPAKAKLAKVTPLSPPPKKAAAPAAKAKSSPPPPAPRKAQETHTLPHVTSPAQVQAPKQSLARSFYWSELRVGDDLPPLTKPAIDRVQIIRYASAAGDFNRLHVDEPFAHSAGFPGLFAPGMLAMAFVGQLLSAWLRRGHVRKLSARFIKLVWPGDELTCHGRIADLRKDGGACYADVELWAENQKGELVLRGHATCELYEAPAIGGSDGGGLLFALQQAAQPMISTAQQQKAAPPRAAAPAAPPKSKPPLKKK